MITLRTTVFLLACLLSPVLSAAVSLSARSTSDAYQRVTVDNGNSTVVTLYSNEYVELDNGVRLYGNYIYTPDPAVVVKRTLATRQDQNSIGYCAGSGIELVTSDGSPYARDCQAIRDTAYALSQPGSLYATKWILDECEPTGFFDRHATCYYALMKSGSCVFGASSYSYPFNITIGARDIGDLALESIQRSSDGRIGAQSFMNCRDGIGGSAYGRTWWAIYHS